MEIKKYDLNPIPRDVSSQINDDIFLTVEIGNGQIGGNKLSINDKIIAKGSIATSLSLGKADILKNKEIILETNVIDVNTYTNACVITTTFKNQNNKVLFSKIDTGDAPENGIACFVGKYRICVLILLFIVLSTFSKNVFCQEVGFKDLETPASPGLILLDQSPSAIEKPTTPQGVGLSLLGFFQGGAFEVAPFWLKEHPKLTAEKMYTNKFPFLNTISFSIASVDNDSNKYIAGGIRARLYQLYSQQLINKLDSIKKEIENALADMNIKLIEELQKQYVAIIGKPVFSIDVATAIAGNSIDNNAENFDIKRRAAWLSLNWRPKGDDFYITALGRYIYNVQFEKYSLNSDLIDVGARMNYDINDFCISIEYLQRMNLTSDNFNYNRLAFIGNYKVNDNLFITATVGKNYSDKNNLITLIGVNFGFSKNKLKLF